MTKYLSCIQHNKSNPTCKELLIILNDMDCLT